MNKTHYATIVVDDSHQVMVWKDSTGIQHYYPEFWAGNQWNSYQKDGLPVEFTSYPDGAVHAHSRAVGYITNLRRKRDGEGVLQP